MKKVLFFALAVAMVACGEKDPKAQLEALRADYAAMGEQIRTLEASLGDAAKHKAEAKVVTTESVVAAPFTRMVNIQGMVDGNEIISINPRVAGEIVWLNMRAGQGVRTGEVLARLDDKILRKSIDEVKTSLNLANTMYERQAALWRDSIGAEIQYIQARNQKEALEARLASLAEQLDMYQIKAPFDGTLESVTARLGQMANPSTPVAMMVNLGKLKVVAEVSESYSSSVAKGDKLTVTFPDINRTCELVITSVSNIINPKNRTFAIEAMLPGGIKDVKANMLAKVALQDLRLESVIAVPVNVVFRNTQGEYIFVVEDKGGKKVATRRTVTSGVNSGSRVVITEGLAAGEQIVTAGYQTLEDGIEVVIN